MNGTYPNYLQTSNSRRGRSGSSFTPPDDSLEGRYSLGQGQLGEKLAVAPRGLWRRISDWSLIPMLVLLAFVIPARLLLAQEGETRKESTKGAVIKGKAPINKDVLAVTFPRPKESRLANGLTLLVLEDHRLPRVVVQMLFPRGSLSEPVEAVGLANMTAELLKEGAGGKSSLDLAQQLEGMGATFYATADFGTNLTDVGISGLSEHSSELLALFGTLVLRPDFPTDEVKKYQERKLAELQQQRAQAGFLAQERFMSVLFPGHPASVTALNEGLVKGLQREHLLAYHHDNYRPAGALLAISGDVNAQEIRTQVEALFGTWPTETGEKMTSALVEEAAQRQIYLVDRPGSVQTNLILGNLGISRTAEDYVAVTVMNRIFGSTSSSRLFMKLREELGYTYGAYCRFTADSHRGPWMMTAEVRTEVTEPSLDEFIRQVERIREELVTTEELENAKRSLIASFALSLERSKSLTGRALELRRYGLPVDYWDRYPAMVQSITVEDVQRVAKKYLDSNRMQIVAVGDGSRIRESLKKFGPVEEYTTEGKLRSGR